MKRQLPVTKVNRPRAAVPRTNRKRRTGHRIRVKRLILLIVILGIIGYAIYILLHGCDSNPNIERSRNVWITNEPERKAVHEKSEPFSHWQSVLVFERNG